MAIHTESYLVQEKRWPKAGRHILAQFDAETVVVYQAFRTETGHFAAWHGHFGEGFSLNRMSWIKPNFLWMMFRSGWATKEGQEVVLAIWLKRIAFDEILKQAVHSTFAPHAYATEAEWKSAVLRSSVRLQWDPDHNPSGNPIVRRAIQLGLRGKTLAQYAKEWITQIEDISDFVREQHQHVKNRRLAELITPLENGYSIADPQVAAKLGISALPNP